MIKGLRRVLARYGDERRVYSANMFKCMQQAFGGIKEIKIANRESYFQNDFEKQNEVYTHVIKQNAFLSAIPKPVMEALCIAGLMAVIAIQVANGTTDTTQFIGVLGVFAAAAFKLLPSVNKISSYFAAIVHNAVVIEKVRDEYREMHETKFFGGQKKSVRRIPVKRRFPWKEKSWWRHWSFLIRIRRKRSFGTQIVVIPKNCSAAFIGPSGAGKTTFVDLILGILTPQKGSICVDGTGISRGAKGLA